jgi:mono/diheme cytochrome c family protein
MRTARLAGLAGVAAAGLGAAVLIGHAASHAQGAQPASPADPQLVARGRYVVAEADCEGCHTKQGGQSFAGGRPIATPFGTVLSANLTPAGIGDWTPDQFYRALHEGIDDEGKHLYPAFPYTYYTKMSRADSNAAFAYLKTLKPVETHYDRNQLNFPFNIRFLMTFWNWLFLKKGEYQPNPAKSAEWNRGAYLVEGPGHCGACHTPTNLLGGPRTHDAYQGGRFGLWFAPDITPNKRTGLGGWSRDELLAFLKTGRNAHAQASGEMGEVVNYSTSQLTDADLGAIATYLADRPASPVQTPAGPDAAVMRQGQAIWQDSCSACHRMDGQGAPRFFPPMPGDANLQQRDPTTIVHIVLTGVRTAPTGATPTPLSMPSYAWKLNDDQIAAVLTYVRNSWGNRASPVSAHDVAGLRKHFTFGPGPAGAERPTPVTRPGPTSFASPNTDSRDNGTANAGRAAPANDSIGGGGGAGSGSGGGAANGGADQGHPGGVASTGPG